jgi:hypothetical protein
MGSKKRKVASPSTPRKKQPSWQAMYAVVILGMFAIVSLQGFGVGQPVGGAAGYYATYFAWAEDGTPHPTQRAAQKFANYVKPRPEWSRLAGKDITADEDHFWLYSMLAAAFYWPLKLCGADVGLGFNCLHLALLYVAVVLAHRRLGPAAAWSLVILVVGSPVLWYANKAHAELYANVLGSLGAVYLLAGLHGRSAVCFALIGVQIPPFGLIALLVLAVGVVSRGWKEAVADWKLVIVAAAVLALHPAYFWLRKHTLSPMLDGQEFRFLGNLFPLRHMAAFWIDPDIGLLATWPLGLPLLIAGLVMLVRQRSRRRIEYAAFFVLSWLLLAWTCSRLTTGVGGDATVDVSRYSVWLIWLYFPILWKLLRWAGQQPRWMQRAAAIAGVALIGASAWLYQPRISEGSRRPTEFSNWLYANASGFYNPVPRIFYASRGGQVEPPGKGGFRCRDWAVSDASGNKILVCREAFQRQSADAPDTIVGRGCLDPVAVYKIAQEQFDRYPNEKFCYINGRGKALFSPAEIHLERPIYFGQDGRLDKQDGAARFLGSGWNRPSAEGVWSNGDRCELIFDPQDIDAKKNYSIHLRIGDVAGSGSGPRMLETSLNGAPLGTIEVMESTLLGWVVSGEKLSRPTTFSLTLRDADSRRQPRKSDAGKMGITVVSLEMRALAPPPDSKRTPPLPKSP